MKVGSYLFTFILLVSGCRADSHPPAREPISHSRDGRFVVRLSDSIQVFELAPDAKSYRRISEFSPGPDSRPLKVLISDDGKYVVAFDGDGYHGRGENVVAVYKTDGTKLAAWGLNQILTKDDMKLVRRSMSNVWWREAVTFDRASALTILVEGPDRRYEYQLGLTSLRWQKLR